MDTGIMNRDRTPVVQQVIDYFSEKIEGGEWKVGEKIPSENTLVQQLSVSRPTVRAAIQQYIAWGVMESFHGKGTYLKTDQLFLAVNSKKEVLTPEDFMDIRKVLEFRRCLEPDTSALAASRMTPKALEHIASKLEAMRESVGNRKKFVENDLQFHLGIAQASGNKLILTTLTEIYNQMVRHLELLNELFGYDGIYYHERIMTALEAKNPDKAREEMTLHLQHALDSLS